MTGTPPSAKWENSTLSVLLPKGSQLRDTDYTHTIVAEVCQRFSLHFDAATKDFLTLELDLFGQKTEYAKGLLDHFLKQEGWIVPISDDLRATLFSPEGMTQVTEAPEEVFDEDEDEDDRYFSFGDQLPEEKDPYR